MLFVNQDVICPRCGEKIPFDDYDDIFDNCVDTLKGEYIDYCNYICPNCKNKFFAKIHYSMKFSKITY